MIPRYTRPQAAAIWSPENRFRIWFEIEAYACEAQETLGVIPEGTAQQVWARGKWDIDRIDEIERETRPRISGPRGRRNWLRSTPPILSGLMRSSVKPGMM
jgi:adenylosuccinate lyase